MNDAIGMQARKSLQNKRKVQKSAENGGDMINDPSEVSKT